MSSVHTQSGHRKLPTHSHRYLSTPPSAYGVDNNTSPKPRLLAGFSASENPFFKSTAASAALIIPSSRIDDSFLKDDDDDDTSFCASPLHTTTTQPPILIPTSMSPAFMFLSSFTSPSPPPPPDSEGSLVGGYTLGPIIGHGGFSTIRSASSPSGGIVAVKIIRQSDLAKQPDPREAKEKLGEEQQVWASLSHEHILPLFSVVKHPEATFFITLYCPAGSLYDILKRDGLERGGRTALPQDDAGMMFRQVVRGLRYLHEVAGVVHRDIKLENVLVDEMGVCRIGDFGMTKRIGEVDEEEGEWGRGRRQPRHRNTTQPHSNLSPPTENPVFQPGSLPYAAPELLLPSTSPLAPHPAQDIWALGVLLYVMLTGTFPFNDGYVPRLHMKILTGVYEVPDGIGKGAERVLQGCLEGNVSERWNVAMVDEVAWGIGWGAEGDDASRSDAILEELEIQRRRTHSTSPLREKEEEDVVDVQMDSRVRPSLDAARRRSSSRYQRSLSRAPALGSDRGSRSRSTSRPPLRISPPTLASPSLTPSTSSGSRFESAFTPSPRRGRRLTPQHLISRSPSPSVAPLTPQDIDISLPSVTKVLEEAGGSSRGRRHHRPARSPSYHPEDDQEVLVEDTVWEPRSPVSPGLLEEAEVWPSPPHPPPLSLSITRVFEEVEKSYRRAGSTPPAPLGSPGLLRKQRVVGEDYSDALRFAETPGRRSRWGVGSAGLGGGGGGRSRSVGGARVGGGSWVA